MQEAEAGKDSVGSNNVRPAGLILPVLLISASFPVCVGQVNTETSFERLSFLLTGTPPGGWIKASRLEHDQCDARRQYVARPAHTMAAHIDGTR